MRIFPCLLSTVVLMSLPLVSSAAVVLSNPQWSVALQPDTLAITVTPAGGEALRISNGAARHQVHALNHSGPTQSDWQWDDGAYSLSAVLDGADLQLRIQARAPGTLQLLNQPASAYGKALSLPLAEGAYVPAGHPVWRRHLIETLDRFTTTQDISLPLWSNDHGHWSLSWILTNPFDNTAGFVADGEGVALTLAHRFSGEGPLAPMTMMLHLGPSDPLAGASRYRQWRIAEGLQEPLAEKIRAVPDAKRLLGAAHVYLWGNGLLAVDDVKNWEALRTTLRGDNALAVRLRTRFPREAAKLLSPAQAALDRYQRKALIAALNDAAYAMARDAWQTPQADPHSLAHSYGAVRTEIAALFGAALAPAADWGSGVSVATMAALQKARLSRLWIGLGEGWEGGIWHPEAIAHGVAAGYLLAPYDSYQTAVESTADDRSWITTYLGDAVYRECGITSDKGTFVAGFQRTGRYTRPACVRNALQQRIRAITRVVPFNSWFLDAYATGMVFTSHAPGAVMSQSDNASGNEASMRWVGDALGLVLGSEDGNAVTSGGLLFGHGMQTPVLAWGDSAMHKDRASPYYVGGWYPTDQPAVFFKQVPLKDTERTLHFDPAFRLPLYQTVFHGSVITTHHWLYDNLKLGNVRVENELTQLLYNVPPLYHLSADSLAARLPVMQRQDAFFRPLHERLATQAMTGFRWRQADRRVQETTFEDGTRLLANFSVQPFLDGDVQVPAHAIAAFNGGDRTPVIYSAAAAATDGKD